VYGLTTRAENILIEVRKDFQRALKPGESRVTAQAAAEWAGEGGWQRWSVRDGERASKADDADKFLERKTRTASAEETGGLAQSDG